MQEEKKKKKFVYSTKNVVKETCDRSLSKFKRFLHWWKDDYQLSLQQRFRWLIRKKCSTIRGKLLKGHLCKL